AGPGQLLHQREPQPRRAARHRDCGVHVHRDSAVQSRRRHSLRLYRSPGEVLVASTVAPATADAEPVQGTSLWKDAWRRLFRNRLAVTGLIVVSIVIVASVIGPPIIKATTGYTY